ncbi:MAG: hypothetical protein ACFFDF_25530 [Candidatus Odinarchaeota archaeon]
MMTQTLKKPNIKAEDIDEYYLKYFKNTEVIRPIVLDYLCRRISFVFANEKIRVLTNTEITLISNATQIPKILVHKFIACFLIDLIHIKKFFKDNERLISSKHHDRKVRIYLHKFHRLAPIFDYKRARENAKRLQVKLNFLCFRPQIMTQIAIVIFITDLLDSRPSRKVNKIIQGNLRALCSCSAYAFHRTRNKLGLTTEYVKTIRELK